jgi:hypothetical protein
MELWILLGLVAAVLVAGVVTRLRKPRRRAGENEAKNIYPLW